MKLHYCSSVVLLALSLPVFAATPASGTLTEASGPVTFTGGPYIVPNPSGIASSAAGVNCTAPMSCDEFALTVTIAEKFRKDEKNKKELVQVALTSSGAGAASADLDLYLLDAAGATVGSSTGATATETVSVPLSVLKDGSYTVRIVTGTPLGASSAVDIHIGKGAKSASGELRIEPMVAAPGELMSFDASSLGSTPGGGYRYRFGDSEETSSSDGFALHSFASDGVYRIEVTALDAAGQPSKVSATQPVVVSSADGAAGRSGSGLALGAFGIPVLFSLFGLALLRKRRV